jgi:hypothetical protein
MKFACPPISVNHQSAAFRISSGIGAKFAREAVQFSGVGAQLAREVSQVSGIGKQLQRIVGADNLGFKFDRFAKFFDDFKPMVGDLELPGEAGIGDLAAALNALAVGGDQALLKRLHRRLQHQARNGDTQSAALADWLDLVRMLLAAEALQRMLDWLAAQQRVRELAMLAGLRTAVRASARSRRRPRCEQDPVRTRRCSRAPSATSSLAYYPKVAV